MNYIARTYYRGIENPDEVKITKTKLNDLNSLDEAYSKYIEINIEGHSLLNWYITKEDKND